MSITTFLLAADSKGSGGGSGIGLILPLVLIVLVGYFLFVRPQKARQRKAAVLRSDLAVGAEIMTTAGLFGRVAQIDDESLLLEVAPGVTMRFVKAAVAKVVTPVEQPEIEEPGEETGFHSPPADELPDDPSDSSEEKRPRD